MRHSARALLVSAAVAAGLIIAADMRSVAAQSDPAPVIHEITTLVTPATEYSGIVIIGENLQSADGSCPVEVNGIAAYAESCSPTEVSVVVPWNATSGDVVVFADGVPSNGIPLEIGPLPEDFFESFVRGEIIVKLVSGGDIGAVLESQGEPEDAANPLFNSSDPLLADWYVVMVNEGDEVAKCRAYSMHPDVLEAGPNIYVTVDEPSPEPTAGPSTLPSSGIRPTEGSPFADLVLLAAGALAVFAGVAAVALGGTHTSRQS